MFFKKIAALIFLLICCASLNGQNQFTISGTVSDTINGESAIGALVYLKGTNKGISTNVYGFYSLTLAKGTYEITCSFIGYKSTTQTVQLDQNIHLDFKLLPENNSLNEVVIVADKDIEQEQVKSSQMSAIHIPIDQIKNIPTIGGETDIIKVMQLMPGVKRGNEGQNGMMVRGGNGDDNLILLDEATVYNISHMFGFISVFNNDALKDVTLYKGGFPAQFGGRLSSVMDIRMKDGDLQKFHVTGGIGTISSNLTLEGPLIKDKMSFLVSGRRSYIDQLTKPLQKIGAWIPYHFYDINFKLNYIVRAKDRLYLSMYRGDDILDNAGTSAANNILGTDNSTFIMGNYTSTARWNHIYHSKLFSNVSLIFTRYRYDVEANMSGNSFLTKSKINDIGSKIDYNYYPNTKNTIKYGAFFINHTFNPNMVSTGGEISDLVRSRKGSTLITQEFGIYAGVDWKVDSLLKINYGLRNSWLLTQAKVYAGLEPRLSLAWNFSENQSFKAGYSRMVQYLHLVSSSAMSLPTDLWYPATKAVKPLVSDQVALGYNLTMPKIKSMLSIEAYYKWINNMIDYREGATLILNDNYEKELVTGRGRAYGVETFLSKTKGRFTGWMGYTLSWSKRNFKELNHGETFYAKFDRRHDLSLVGAYDITPRFTLSAVWVYSTGQRITPVLGNYFVPNPTTGINTLAIFADKNSFEMPASHRLDVSFIFKTKEHRQFLKHKGEWHFGAYNLYNRAQPHKIIITDKSDGTKKYQAVGRFGVIPFISYNFKL